MPSQLSHSNVKPIISALSRTWRFPIAIIIVIALVGWTYISTRPATPTVVAPAMVSVVKVVDGDTIDVNLDGQVQRLRLIGVDTPEVVDPRKPVQCFGKQASDYTHSVLDGQQVKLAADPTQDNKDIYGRLLRYVYLANGTLFNVQLIQQGYAHEYTYKIPYQHQDQFKQAQVNARQKGLGLWSASACNGVTS